VQVIYLFIIKIILKVQW